MSENPITNDLNQPDPFTNDHIRVSRNIIQIWMSQSYPSNYSCATFEPTKSEDRIILSKKVLTVLTSCRYVYPTGTCIIMSDDDSMDVCDSLELIDRLYGGGESSPVGHTSCPVATVLFQSSEVEAQHQTSASSLPLDISQYHDSPDEYFVPLEKVGRNYRCLKRRGAAVHSQLLKSAFEASMSSYDSDGDGDGDDFSMHASNSTICSRDGVEDIQMPRKRIRHPVGGGEQQDETTESSIQQASNMFEGLGLMAMHHSAAAASSSANSVSSEESDTIPEDLEHGGSRRGIQRTLSCALKREHYHQG